MAKKPERVNKTKAVTEYLKDHPQASNVEVAEALTKQGVPIKPGYVANIKVSNKKKRRRQARKAVKEVAAKQTGLRTDLRPLMAALNLLKVSGDFTAAQQALGDAYRIRALV